MYDWTLRPYCLMPTAWASIHLKARWTKIVYPGQIANFFLNIDNACYFLSFFHLHAFQRSLRSPQISLLTDTKTRTHLLFTLKTKTSCSCCCRTKWSDIRLLITFALLCEFWTILFFLSFIRILLAIPFHQLRLLSHIFSSFIRLKKNIHRFGYSISALFWYW